MKDKKKSNSSPEVKKVKDDFGEITKEEIKMLRNRRLTRKVKSVVLSSWFASGLILLSCIVFAALAAKSAAFVGTPAISKDKNIYMSLVYPEEEYSSVVGKEEPSENTASPAEPRPEIKSSNICFIGDFRIKNMAESAYSDSHFIYAEDANADWFKTTAMKTFSEQNGVKACVVCLGRNDIAAPEALVEELNKFADEHADMTMYFLTVGPVDENKTKTVKNADIELLNEQIKSGLNKKWSIIDQYNNLVVDGYSTDSSGIYYVNAVNAKLICWITDQIVFQ